MQDAFLSVVEHEAESRLLQVRGRMRGDIERVFPEADVIEAVDGDYRFRTSLPRERVAQAISLRIGKIDYTGFPSTIKENDRRSAYINVWNAMYDEQQRLYGPPPRDEDPVILDRPRYELEDERYRIVPLEDDSRPLDAG